MPSWQGVTVALPLELIPQQNIPPASAFVEEQITAKGIGADWRRDPPGNAKPLNGRWMNPGGGDLCPRWACRNGGTPVSRRPR
jgi:hypothetical protein